MHRLRLMMGCRQELLSRDSSQTEIEGIKRLQRLVSSRKSRIVELAYVF
jgi:hypothetical protein